MLNTCVATGCSDFTDPSKSIGLQKFSEDNESKRNRRRTHIVFANKAYEVVSNTRMLGAF